MSVDALLDVFGVKLDVYDKSKFTYKYVDYKIMFNSTGWGLGLSNQPNLPTVKNSPELLAESVANEMKN